MNPDFIPEGITEDIMKRLPVKSLLRFKCVSKPWLSLISSPRFVKSHLKISSLSPRLMDCSANGVTHGSARSLVLDPVPEIINVDYPDTNTNGRVWFIGSSNGLVCFSRGTNPEFRKCKNNDLFIWNPSTRIVKKIAHVGVEEMDEWMSKFYQFGYNAVDDDYMVLRIFINDEQIEVDVYSLRADSWKKRVCANVGVSPYSEFELFDAKLYISMGTVVLNNSSGFGREGCILNVENIVSWDLGNEVYGIIEQPNYGEGVKILFLETLGGCFSVVCKKETHADLWVMKEFGVKDSWCKILTVPFLNYLEEYYEYPRALLIIPSGEILVYFDKQLEVYNLKNNGRRVLDTSNFGQFLPEHVYVESLVSPTQFD